MCCNVQICLSEIPHCPTLALCLESFGSAHQGQVAAHWATVNCSTAFEKSRISGLQGLILWGNLSSVRHLLTTQISRVHGALSHVAMPITISPDTPQRVCTIIGGTGC